MANSPCCQNASAAKVRRPQRHRGEVGLGAVVSWEFSKAVWIYVVYETEYLNKNITYCPILSTTFLLNVIRFFGHLARQAHRSLSSNTI